MITKRVRVGTGVATAPIYKDVIDWDALWGWIFAIFMLLLLGSCFAG